MSRALTDHHVEQATRQSEREAMVLMITTSSVERMFLKNSFGSCKITTDPYNGLRIGSDFRRLPKSYGRGSLLSTQNYSVKTTGPTDVYLLDFDGVLVDSEPV